MKRRSLVPLVPCATPMSERNKKILRLVFAGEELKVVAKHFGISTPRVRQIVHREAWLRNPERYASGYGERSPQAIDPVVPSLHYLRKNREFFS